jgi:hypothetical protein
MWSSRSPIPVTYVVGSSHSGSTLLALLLDQHPQVACVGETAVKRRIRREGRAASQLCSCGESLGSCGFWQGIFQDVSSSGVRFDADHWSTEYRFDADWLDALLTRETSMFFVRKARHWATHHLPVLKQRTARVDRANVAFAGAVLARTGALVLCDTTKLLTRLTCLLEIPELRINVVRLVRDARGVAASAKRRGGSVLDATTVWVNDQTAIDRVLADRPALPSCLIRYEDLCDHPAATLDELWRFCGVEPIDSSAVVNPRAHHVLGNNMRMGDTVRVRVDEGWRTLLDSTDEHAVWQAAGAMSGRLGYVR